MTFSLSKTQIDRLGDRLKQGNFSDADLRLLDEYRRSFAEAYDSVIGNIRDHLGLEPTGRPAKTTTSIAEKLRREHIRLTQIQDIAGCRLIVSGVVEQDRTLAALSNLFNEATIIDRRERPSHGYRAVHVVVRMLGPAVEIQLRTELQHKWAELSEKLSDLIDPSIKYGGGNDTVKELLAVASQVVIKDEATELALSKIEADLTKLESRRLTDEDQSKVKDLRAQASLRRHELLESRQEIIQTFKDTVTILEEEEREDAS